MRATFRLRRAQGSASCSVILRTACRHGLNTSAAISRQTAEAVEKILRCFLLPHIFGLYDVVVNGGQDRDMIRTIGDFILASTKDRLRPSDITSGVRALRGRARAKVKGMDGAFLRDGLAPARG